MTNPFIARRSEAIASSLKVDEEVRLRVGIHGCALGIGYQEQVLRGKVVSCDGFNVHLKDGKVNIYIPRMWILERL